MILFVMKEPEKGLGEVWAFSFMFYFSRLEAAFDFEAFISAGRLVSFNGSIGTPQHVRQLVGHPQGS